MILELLQSITPMVKKFLRKKHNPNQQQTQLYDKITKIQTSILGKIQKLKQTAKITFCQHITLQNSEVPPYNPNNNYYDLYWRRFLVNEIGRCQIIKLNEEILLFQKKLNKIDQLFKDRQQYINPFQRPRGKKPQNIDSIFTCEFCNKSYTDQEALVLHIKIKHSNMEIQKDDNHEQEDIFEEDEESDQERISV